jgi:hypothetical protein
MLCRYEQYIRKCYKHLQDSEKRQDGFSAFKFGKGGEREQSVTQNNESTYNSEEIELDL